MYLKFILRMAMLFPMYTDEEVDAEVAGMHPAVAKARVFAEWVSWTGRLLPNFNKETNVIEPFSIPEKWRRAVTVDPATTGETAVAFLAERPNTDEWVIYKTKTYKGLAPSELVLEIKNEYPRRGDISYKFYDEAAAWFRAEASKHGEYFSPVNKYKNNESMVNKLNQEFHEAKMKIFSTEIKAMEQILNYSNKEGASEFSPIKRDDHFPDALKYFVWAKPASTKPPKVLTHNERLWKAVDKQIHSKAKLKGHPKLGNHY